MHIIDILLVSIFLKKMKKYLTSMLFSILLSRSNNNIDNSNIKIITPNSVILYVESKQIISQPKIVALIKKTKNHMNPNKKYLR